MTSRTNPIESPGAEIQFVLSECFRIHEITSRMKPNEFLKVLSKADLAGDLKLSNGRKILCGSEAVRRLHRLATVGLRESDAAGTIEPHRVYRAFESIVAQRFIEEQQSPDDVTVGDALAAAVEEAKLSRFDSTHFVPCQLMFVKDPSVFAVGPVTFRARASFHETMESHYCRLR